MKGKVNPRKKALDTISTKIATFLVTQTYTDEQEAQGHLEKAIASLDEAAALLVESDEKAEAKTAST